jgi:hypothetical protein
LFRFCVKRCWQGDATELNGGVSMSENTIRFCESKVGGEFR